MELRSGLYSGLGLGSGLGSAFTLLAVRGVEGGARGATAPPPKKKLSSERTSLALWAWVGESPPPPPVLAPPSAGPAVTPARFLAPGESDGALLPKPENQPGVGVRDEG